MQRSTLRIILIAVLNLMVLSILMCLWTDSLVLTFDPGVRYVELLQLVRITLIFLIGWRVVSAFSRRKNKVPKSNWKAAALILLLLSSYWYITYSQKIIANVLQHGPLREHLAAKIKPSHGSLIGQRQRS